MDTDVQSLRRALMKKSQPKTKDYETARAWVADAESATGIMACDLAAIQKKFNHRLVITRKNDGSIVIYPECPGERSEFDAFMEQNGSFTQQPVRLNKL